MKLLPKSEVLQKQAAVKKQSIDEGVKIAKHIDRLREVASLEEQSLEKFRSETVEAIHKEITSETTKRDELRGEVRELEAAKKEALSPLTAEINLINKGKSELEEKEKEVKKERQALDIDKEEWEGKKKEISDTLTRIATVEEEARKKFEEANNNEKATKASLLKQKEKEQEAIRLTEKLEKEIVHRENQCQDRENGVILREKELQSREADLMKSWRKLEDRKAAFERNLKRIKS